MSRVDEYLEVANHLCEQVNNGKADIDGMKVCLLGNIAMSLALIVDKLTEEQDATD